MKCDVLMDIINQIENKRIKAFTIEILNNVDPIFYKLKASSTGRYHPAECNTEGGLIRHIQRVCWFAHILIDSQRWYNDNIKGDIILSSCLLHDIGKKDKYSNRKEYDDHPIIAYNFAKNYSIMLDEKIWKLIGGCILNHMGQYGPESLKNHKQNLLEYIVSFSDILASKKEIIVDVSKR